MVDAEAETTFAPAIWWRLLHKSAKLRGHRLIEGWKIPSLPRHDPRHQSHVARHPLPQERFPDRLPKIGQRRLLKLPRSCQFFERSFTTETCGSTDQTTAVNFS